MKIMRYYEIKALGPVLPVNNGRYQINPDFNLSNCEGEIIILLGSRLSSQNWLAHLFPEQHPSSTKVYAATPFRKYNLPVASNYFQTLSPLQNFYDQVYEVVKICQPHLTYPQKQSVTKGYLKAAGLGAYQFLTPIQAPGIVLQQAKLAMRFATGYQVILLDNLFDPLSQTDKSLLHISLLNLQDSEPKPRTIIYATQNLDDALFMADRILIMNPVKTGTVAENLNVNFNRPRNRQLLKTMSAYKNLRRQLHYLLTDALALEDYLLLR